jgi:hypothetical protein
LVSRVDVRADVSRFETGADPVRAAAPAGSGGVTGLAVSPTTASVSWTGRSAVAGTDERAGADVADVAASGVGTAFCREARYPPPAAAAMHPAASAANASRFENMTDTPYLDRCRRKPCTAAARMARL